MTVSWYPTKYWQTTPVHSSGNLIESYSQCLCSTNLCSQSTLSQTAAIFSNLFLSAAVWEYWNITWIAALSCLILQWQNTVFLQQVLFTEMPGKQEFVLLPLGGSKYTQECFAKPGKRFKKRAWALLGNCRLIVKTWNKYIQCSESVLQLNHVNVIAESMTIGADRATRIKEIYVNNSLAINN